MKTPFSDSVEFSRGFTVDRLYDKPFKEHIEASETEREALASRLDLVALKSLEADLILHRVQPGDILEVTGVLRAEVVQNCVVSLEDFPTTVEEKISAYFAEAPAGNKKAKLAEEDLAMEDEHAPDPIPPNGEVDLGELVAQHLSLALDPYPRKPGVEFKPVHGGGEENRNPFAVLAEFREKKK